ncbi:MAG: CPBP family glutamic-type intramembrane protease, partial [Candidatus Helarchaeota archaeon]
VQAFNIEAFIPYLFTDMIILIMAMKLVTLAPAVIGTTYYESKKYNLSLANVGLSRKNALRSMFVGTIAALIFIATINICDYIMVYPLLYPAISPTINIWGFILVLLILLGANFIDELIFRGLAVSKMQTQNKWLVYFVSIGYHSLTAGISTLVIFSLYAGGSLLLLILAFGIGMVLGIINGITNTYIYQRTGNILGGVIFSTLILGFFMCGHFIGLGLITF